MSVEEARAYAERSQLYLENAAAMLRQQRPEKAGEFLWGAVAQALKAVAALKDIKLHAHVAIRKFARDTAKRTKNGRLLEVYSIAKALHSNFYEGMFDVGHVRQQAVAIRDEVNRLLDMVPTNQERVEE